MRCSNCNKKVDDVDICPYCDYPITDNIDDFDGFTIIEQDVNNEEVYIPDKIYKIISDICVKNNFEIRNIEVKFDNSDILFMCYALDLKSYKSIKFIIKSNKNKKITIPKDYYIVDNDEEY